MDRRLFFRAILGAPVLGAAAAVPAERVVMARAEVPTCECGFAFWVHRAYLETDLGAGKLSGIAADRDIPRCEYMECLNERCAHFGRPFGIPRVQLAPANPDLVKFVREELARQAEREREWKRKYEDMFVADQQRVYDAILTGEPRPFQARPLPTFAQIYRLG